MKNQITIKVISKCNGMCRYCAQLPWRGANIGYEMTLSEIMDFVKYTVSSGYHFRMITITGGEPFLWPHLLKSCQLIQEANIAKDLRIITNAMTICKNNLDFLHELIDIIDVLTISRYGKLNSKNIAIIINKFSKSKKLQIYKVIGHYIPPAEPIGSCISCSCPFWSLMGSQVCVCQGMEPILLSLGKCPKDYPEFFSKIGPNYLDKFKSIKKAQSWCKLCITNREVRKHCKRFNNETQK